MCAQHCWTTTWDELLNLINMILPVIIFHQLLHILPRLPCKCFFCLQHHCLINTRHEILTDMWVRESPPLDILNDPSQAHLVVDPNYLSQFPMIHAFGAP